MLTNKRERARQQRTALWATRDDVQRHALSMSLPWLAFVNIAFALMIFSRNFIFTYFDKKLLTHQVIIPYIEIALIAVIIISAILVIIAVTPRLAQGRYTLNIITALLLVLSLCWSLSNYCFIFFWALPFAWPLLVILLTTGLTALYHHWPGIIAFMLPLWGTALLAGIQIHYHAEIRFLILWAIFTAILLYGRRILQRWYDEAWDTHQENMQLIQRLESIANQDALTGTANRRALNAYLAEIWQQNTPLSLMMIDVDYFKRYNDRYGHQAGDECLSSVAQVLKMAVRAEDDLVARYGGEEFVVALPRVHLVHATAIAERIQQKIHEAALPHEASEVASVVTVSIGIVDSDGTVPMDTLIARADSALYQAKNKGRNQWSY
ncbi:sensor domain-containing diguanylate cyclase [Klebsiella quasipneumoniae]|uniref:sensor domain-containing diguanylate cyclase n=1 Tax=Klebsiella quasipneumoniae TaxID=1463165 RepID=UPI00084C2EAB|nr:GGDEF domain-containing protein [Klebsiella quasipneumoniae]MCL8069233.1 GGDEF domain-containing protein [Klebsiella quasipneumoniae]MDE4781222.1 GGDEF domain-containing protein [Klebsiella quasipneumoniae subsp. similipneumoniae]MDM7369652.1 GGDEF domain-containing protein [Klebsiella quasipneumoniae]OED26376.1 diguanylate cyclase [Klebsiella quasipneumoniae]UKL43702.1 GGDEF domain-containing protein [Klebsiella quasipneumoniae]